MSIRLNSDIPPMKRIISRMADRIRHIHAGLIILCLFPSASLSQGRYSEWETELLNTVIKDTTSQLSAYLPHRYSFGVRGPKNGRLLLVKDGSYNRLLPEGTHRVYEIRSRDGRPHVKRLDSTVFHGDNHDMIGFRRKDTLYEYGGHGNWAHRDFITRYRDGSRDWEYVRAYGRMPENRFTPFQYNREEDRLYVFGSLALDRRNQKEVVGDSVHTFDFRTRIWTAKSRVENDDGILPHNPRMGSASCSFDGGVLFSYGGRIVLADLSKGRYRYLSADSLVSNVRVATDSILASDSTLWLLLSDTLHAFIRTENGYIHSKRRFSTTSLQAVEWKSLWVEGPDRSLIHFPAVVILSICLIPMVSIVIWRRRSKAATSEGIGDAHTKGDETRLHGSPYPAGPRHVSPSHESVLSRAREYLSPTDWELFTRLVCLSAEGESMDASTLNQFLGVGQKSPEVRKARRNKSLSNINRVFAAVGLEEEPLISHERDEFDKRAFRYKVREDLALELKRILDEPSHTGLKSV